MPISRGKKIIDARPQAAASPAGAGTVPFPSDDPSSSSSARTAPSSGSRRGVRRVTSSVVEGIVAAEKVPESADASAVATATSVAPVADTPPHFRVPSAVLQRMQQLQQQQQQQTLLPPELPVASAATEESETAVSAPRSSEHPTPDTMPPAAHTVAKTEQRTHPSSFKPSSLTPGKALEHPHTSAAISSPGADDESVGVAAPVNPEVLEEVSEADVSATLRARKSVSTHQHEDLTTATQPAASSSSSAGTESTTKSTSAIASAVVTAVKAKPIIFSRQWRQKLFSNSASSPSAMLASAVAATSDEQSGDHGSQVESKAEDEEEDDDELSPFGRANVIKFRRADGAPNPSLGGPENAAVNAAFESSASEVPSDDSDSLSTASGDAESEQGRLDREALRQHARAQRDKLRVRKHMSGFDEDFLQEQEEQLRQNKAAGSEDESGSEEEEEDGSHDSSSAEDEVEDEEEVSESHAEAADEEAEAPSTPSTPRKASTGGFGARDRVHMETQQAKGLQQRATTENRCNASPQQSAPALLSSSAAVAIHQQEQQQSAVAAVSGAARSKWFDSFFFAVHENRLHKGGCHHTLLGLRDPVSIQGLCGLIGFGLGEVCVNGFYLGKKQLNLWHEDHHAVLLPMKKLKTKHSQDMELPQWPSPTNPAWPPGRAATAATTSAVSSPSSPSSPSAASPSSSAFPSSPSGKRGGTIETTREGGDKAVEERLLGQPLNPQHFLNHHNDDNVNGDDTTETEESFLQSLQWNSEAVFGDIDWDWVEKTVQNWRNLFSNKMPPIVLVVQPSSSVRRGRGSSGPMRKYYTTRKRSRDFSGMVLQKDQAARSYMEVPAFVSRRRETTVDLALLPSVVPSIAAQGSGCVMVLGSANIGKSTLCRFLTNVLLSQHGVCYWLDLDVGQPEFGVPGQLSLLQVRRPLLRDRDESCVHRVTSFFIGANTAVQCPLTTANALSAICAQAAAIAREHPVVVNTHGWVLQTGRRVTVEALRRLRPRQVIHLYKGAEVPWAQDTAALLDPRNGLNAEVVQRRFLIHHGPAETPAKKGGSKDGRHAAAPSAAGASPSSSSLLCRLPYPHEFEVVVPTTASSPTSPNNNSSGGSKTPLSPTSPSRTWRGQVHAVRVEREETYSMIQIHKATKGSKGRQQRWQMYFAPLLRFYAQRHTLQRRDRKSLSRATSGEDEAAAEPETTLLEAPLSQVRSIVLAERDEKAGDVRWSGSDRSTEGDKASSEGARTRAEVAAALEHAVVAVLFHAMPATAPEHAEQQEIVGGCVVRSLASLPCGFPVSCYGVIESSEEELLHGVTRAEAHGEGQEDVAPSKGEGWIRLRLPLKPSVVAAMLRWPASEGKLDRAKAFGTSGGARAATYISIAHSVALRQDTAFVDV